MNINDDSVRAYYAARDLLRLYDVYRSKTRAQIATDQQIRRQLADRKPNSKQVLSLARIDRHEALLWHTDAVFGDRREQVRRRLFEILGLPELP
jgi:hypothetical protein